MEKLKLDKLLPILILILIFSSNPPWFIFGFNYYIVALIIFLIFGCILISKKSPSRNFLYALPILIIAISYFLFFKSLGEFRFSTVLFFLTYTLTFFINDNIKNIAFDSFNKVLGYSVLISLVFWLFHNFLFKLPFNFPLDYSGALGKGEGMVVTNYIAFIQPDLDYFRFYGFFDEPGVLGTLAAIVLLGSKYDFRKKENIFILLGGIFTFSLAFYVVTILGYLINSILMKRVKQTAIVVFSILSLFPFLLTIEAFKLSILYRLTNFNQSVQERNGVLLDQFYNSFLETSHIYFGESLNFFSENSVLREGQSYKFFIIEYGFLGLIILILLYVFLIDLKKINLYILFTLFVFLVLFTQRPFMFTPWGILLFSIILPKIYKR